MELCDIPVCGKRLEFCNAVFETNLYIFDFMKYKEIVKAVGLTNNQLLVLAPICLFIMLHRPVIL